MVVPTAALFWRGWLDWILCHGRGLAPRFPSIKVVERMLWSWIGFEVESANQTNTYWYTLSNPLYLLPNALLVVLPTFKPPQRNPLLRSSVPVGVP